MRYYLLTFFTIFCFYNINAQSGFDDLWKKFDSIQKVKEPTRNYKKEDAYKSIPKIDARKETQTKDSVQPKIIVDEIKKQPIAPEKKTTIKSSLSIETIKNYNEIPVVNLKTKVDSVKTKSTIKNNTINTSKLPESSVITKTYLPTKQNTTIKKEEVIENIKQQVLKSNFDTTKNFKDFSFETTPIVNGNATYNKPNPIKQKNINEVDESIPVNKNNSSTNVNTVKDNSIASTNYSAFTKEAAIIRNDNDKKLDSVLKTMQLNIPVQINPSDYIDIYLNGGSVLLDNDSKLYDRISILNNGRVHREFKTKNAGEQRLEKNITRDQLLKLAQYLVDLGYYNFNTTYDCLDDDNACAERLTSNPVLLPLQISITIGDRKKKVYVSMYAPKHEKNLVNYPADLIKIMNAIYSIVER